MLDRLRQNHLAGILSVTGGLLLWELVSRVFIANPLFLAAPSQIAYAVYALTVTGEMGRHVAVSSAEFAIGYVIASVIGIAFGFGMANSVRFKQALQPWISGFYATPTIALAPLFILWLGIGIWSKVLVVIFLVLFPVTINTEAGLRTTSERLIEMLKSFGASGRQIFFKVSLPSALPFILAGLKLGIGRGLIGVVVAELFGSRAGLGRLISQSADSFHSFRRAAAIAAWRCEKVGGRSSSSLGFQFGSNRRQISSASAGSPLRRRIDARRSS